VELAGNFTGASCIALIMRTASWLLSKPEDPFGITILYNYELASVPIDLRCSHTRSSLASRLRP
jgi:hypothetical protein